MVEPYLLKKPVELEFTVRRSRPKVEAWCRFSTWKGRGRLFLSAYT